MTDLQIHAELASALNANTPGFRKCCIYGDPAVGLCYSFDTTGDAELFRERRSTKLEGRKIEVTSIGAEVYERWVWEGD